MRLFEKVQSDKHLIKKLTTIAANKGYVVFNNNSKIKMNLNIWGIRSKNQNTKEYNDVIIVFYGSGAVWKKFIFEATTDPSDLNLIKPVNSKGCAILTEGQHRSLWKFGKHKGYDALVQYRPCTVIRDNDKDSNLDFNGKLDTGMFGINCHRASKWKISNIIGLYSAGCQVFKSVKDFEDIFMTMIYESKNIYNSDTFTYTLINETDYDSI